MENNISCNYIPRAAMPTDAGLSSRAIARLRSQGTGVRATAQASQPGNGGPPTAQAQQVSKYKKRKIRELVGMSDVMSNA
jgi:hypothetical protein